MKQVIFDTGPLVAWFCPRDEHHAWARRAFAEFAPGSTVCEAVLPEVCHLVAKERIARGTVIQLAAWFEPGLHAPQFLVRAVEFRTALRLAVTNEANLNAMFYSVVCRPDVLT